MSYIVKCAYKDFAGSGFFVLVSSGVSWGFGPDTKHFSSKEDAIAAASAQNLKDSAHGTNKNGELWTVMETGR